MAHRILSLVLTTTFSVGIAGQVKADVMLGQVDDFQDGTVQGWSIGQGGAFAPSNPGGFLSYTTSGSAAGPGSKMAIYNRSQWTGNFSSAGVTAIMADIRNPGSSALNLRLALSDVAGPAGTWFASSTATVIDAGADWTKVEFSLAESDLVRVGGAGNLAGVLSDVVEMRVLSSTTAHWRGDTFLGTLEMDNVSAVPEPASWVLALLGAGLLGICVRHRRRKLT